MIFAVVLSATSAGFTTPAIYSRVVMPRAPQPARAPQPVASDGYFGEDLPESEEGWMTVLSPNQFAVLRNAATEPPGFSELTEGELEHGLKKDFQTKYPDQGAYLCTGCGIPLYFARTKFNSGCGWPAFYDGVPGAIEERPDADGSRVEIVCSKCKVCGAARRRPSVPGSTIRLATHRLARVPVRLGPSGPRLQGRGLPEPDGRAPLRQRDLLEVRRHCRTT